MMIRKVAFAGFIIPFFICCSHNIPSTTDETGSMTNIDIETVKLTHLEFPGSESIRDNFSYLLGINLLLPCPDVTLPDQSNLLPNAARQYRNGIHRGIDFQADYGAPVLSAMDGIVIRADHGFREVTPLFRRSLLKKAAQIGRTPSDVFDNILLGRSVFIDHGTDLVPGKRLLSIYAHLSEIDGVIQVGREVKKGQILGLAGNSGTSDGTKGNKTGAHLHFELIIQDAEGERYMGQGLEFQELKILLNSIFVQKIEGTKQL